jgi:NMD protein affecting ribosome stability and mRNA decay
LFFGIKKECRHDKVTPDKDSQYCPDCGQYIENRWYLTRCSCCNVKRKTVIKLNEIVPETRFCPNCGAEHYRVELVKSINFIDINFAALVKEINHELSKNKSQTWLERDNTESMKLLGFS